MRRIPMPGCFPLLEHANGRGLNGRHTSLFYDFARLLGDALPHIVILEKRPGPSLFPRRKRFRDHSQHTGRNSGMAWRGECLTADFSASPSHAEDSTLLDIVETRPEQPQYYLSPNAAQGILRRAAAQGRNLFSPFKESLGDPSVGPVVQRLGYCLAATSGRHTGTDWSRTYVTYPDAVRRLTPLEAERLQGFPDGWTVPDGLTSKEIESLDSARYAALGNAVTVPVAEWIGKRLVKATQLLSTP